MLNALLLTALLTAGPEEAARRHLEAHGITVTASNKERVPPEVWEALVEGLSRIPPPLRRFPGGPLELQLNTATMPYGMGTGEPATGHPAWSWGRRRFHLYDVADAMGSPARDTKVLSARAHARLWRQRALVHAVMQRWEDQERFSRSAHWRRVMGWRGPLEGGVHLQERARNVYEGAYLRQLGQKSAALDLLTFAEARFVPVEALAPGRLEESATLPCQEPTRLRALDRILADRGLLLGSPEVPACRPFEEWARPDALEQLEVLLVAPSGRQAESLFGHLLLRPLHRRGELGVGQGLAPVVQLAALAEDERAGLRRIWRGLTGGYLMTVFTLTHADLVEEALHDQQRTIRRYRLNLQPEMARRVLERAWEAERRGYFPYTFLSGNCAFLLAFLLEPALPEDIRIRFGGLWLISPGSTLDALESIRLPDEQGTLVPLLTYVPGDLEATGEQAERSEAQRRHHEVALEAALPPEHRAEWTAAMSRVRALEPAVRELGFREVAALSGQVPRTRDVALHAWWAHAVRVERDRVERARHALLRLSRATVEDPRAEPVPIGDRVAVRQALFDDPEALAERPMLIDRTEAERLHLASLKHRPDTPEEARIRARSEATLAVFSKVTGAQATLNLDRFSDQPATALLSADAEAARLEDAHRAAASQTRSGAWRRAIGGGLRGSGTPFLRFETAGLAELLGDQRLHGMHPSTELRILHGRLDLTAGPDGWPRTLASELTLVGFRTLAQQAPHLQRGFLDSLGWGASLGFDRRPERALTQRLQASAEAWLPLERAAHWTSFSALGVGVALGGLWGSPFDPSGTGALGPASLAGGMGPMLLWRSRIALSGQAPTALRLTGRAQSTWLSFRGRDIPAWQHELEAELQLEVLVGRGGALSGFLRPGASVSLDALGRGALRPVAAFSLSFEPSR